MNGKIKLLIFNSILITALPLLGFPRTIKNVLLFVVGFISLLALWSIKKGVKLLRLKLKRIEGQQGTLIQ